MKALCWHGTNDIRYDTVPDPRIEDSRDAIIKMTSCAICGSDLHLFDGFVPGMSGETLATNSWRSGRGRPREMKGDVVSGLKNKIQVALANVTPSSFLAGQHRKMAGPHSVD